ncbi:PREDICTED: ectonucleoside triphosphate diphosphohydrolase 8-like [Nanorana parkeri]|uniref:ectonucleoside triphosphate diphosphohydrolase 8-like n=1 Tax=Nanorana parkeri TaxID=125878 RepID=UPI000854CFBF|nr:PREDICTED: ectonucleoside triphosphate diphosphohydrolase 8-like [Nanorana parkeri]
MQCRNRKGLAVGCLIVISTVSGVIALILSLVDIQTVYQPSPNKYGLVFDAGSSHTSLYVYQWPAHKENDTGIVSQIHICEVPGSGLSAYADNAVQAGEVLKYCMDEALSIIPSEVHKETTVLLGATAGMRLLKLQNETKTQNIFDAVSRTLGTYPVDFQGARILDGTEEGSLGWITVNYLLGTFIQYSYLNSWIHPQQAQMFGAMDLGGASTQMTFQPAGDIEDKSTEMVFRLYGFDYSIYTHSYLCYGQDQALKRLLVYFIENKSSGNVKHPCYPNGYTANISLSSVYNSQCVLTAPDDIGANVTVEGTGDPSGCQMAIKHIFNFSECSPKSCSFNGIYQPPVHGEFYAFSAFYYTFKFLNLTDGQTLDITNSSVWNFCTRDWDKLSANFPDENRKRLLDYCSSAMYILTLLVDGYKFDSRTWNNIHFSKQAGNADVGWTLGYMLNMTNRIPSEGPSLLKAHSYNLWVAAIFFIVLSVAAGLVAAPLHCYFRNACSGQGGLA